MKIKPRAKRLVFEFKLNTPSSRVHQAELGNHRFQIIQRVHNLEVSMDDCLCCFVQTYDEAVDQAQQWADELVAQIAEEIDVPDK
jgi:hypothetical protein